jgi:hypothetical protein
VCLALLVVGLVLSIVGNVVEGHLWLTVIGILVFLGAAVHAAFARRSKRPTG